MPRGKKGKDDSFDNPGDFIRERHRLQEQNDKLWKKYGDLQFGPKGPDGKRIPKLARPEAARNNASIQMKNMGGINSISKWLKKLKS
jgi:hypothetical protein